MIAACLVCDSVELRTWPAVVAPFIADYAVGAAVPPSHLMECQSCGFRFFDARLTDAEAGRLYAEYRRDRYFRCRHHHEFWYTRGVNDGIGRNPQEIVGRTQACERFLRQYLEPEAIGRVLDFGGDRGQFIPPCVGREKYVFEISDAVPVQGVRQVSAASEIPCLVGRSAFRMDAGRFLLNRLSRPLGLRAPARGDQVPRTPELLRRTVATDVAGAGWPRGGGVPGWRGPVEVWSDADPAGRSALMLPRKQGKESGNDRCGNKTATH